MIPHVDGHFAFVVVPNVLEMPFKSNNEVIVGKPGERTMTLLRELKFVLFLLSIFLPHASSNIKG